ncbi:hypothetical protein CPB84DRAFT_1771402 [Gymnopilus junonius]|uniref:Uncharacterized protein n=1 Tax=Gymnopilus junonius TaxID=109634 RepID=A0A9P5NQQ0_GYMJU|nr:hypothetical protein CPB84DRAFT_1771402 [Gymnopilus junonius]
MLKPPKGNNWGCSFISWYSDPHALEGAVSGYLASLFNLFTIPVDTMLETTYIFYSLPSVGVRQTMLDWTTDLKADIFGSSFSIGPVSSAAVPFPYESVKCTLVASNSSPGFGPSYTQEELVTAVCPSLLPMGALFVSPPAPEDVAIMIHTHVPICRSLSEIFFL